MQQSNERTRSESRRWLKSSPTPGIVHWLHLPARGHSSHKPSLLESYHVRSGGVMLFAGVTLGHHSFIFCPKQTKAQDEKPQHPTYTRPSEKSVIDHMLGILHTIQHAEPVALNAKMSHSPQLCVTLCHLSWYFSGQLIQIYYK